MEQVGGVGIPNVRVTALPIHGFVVKTPRENVPGSVPGGRNCSLEFPSAAARSGCYGGAAMSTLVRRFAVALVSVSCAAAQATLVVPGTHATIQAAIAAALPSDTVLVLPGTYVERIDFLGKAITVRGVAGAAATTIDGNQLGPVVSFVTNETPASVIEGFTITNGLGLVVTTGTYPRSTAGGIQCVSSSPTIQHCVIAGNRGGPGTMSTPAHPAGYGGPGGILAQSSALRLLDCVVSGNFGGVGGIGVTSSSPGGGDGGAGGANFVFDLPGAVVEITRCRFAGNLGGTGGMSGSVLSFGGGGGDGGVEVMLSSPAKFVQCEFAGNIGGTGGPAGLGGLSGRGGNGGFDAGSYPLASSLTMVSCAVVGNTGGNGGGGVNTRGGNGGGASGGTAFFAIGCTVAGNVSGAPLLGNVVSGGVFVGAYATSSALLRNCIAWGNTRGGQPSDLDANSIVASAQDCDFGAVTGIVVGTGLLGVDPMFVNLAGGDVHLTAGSPCLHTGGAAAGQSLFDIDGDPRTVGPAPDMGADEFDALVGSREDFALDLAVNGAWAAAVNPSTVPAGSIVAVHLQSPGGTFGADPVLVGIEPWLPPAAPSGPVFLPELQLSPAALLLTLGGGVGASGITLATGFPPGLAGLALRVQAFAFSAAAHNGFFAATAARDMVF